MAARREKWFSRRHVILEPLADGRVRVLNLSRHALMDHTEGRQARLPPYGQGNLEVPFLFHLGDLTLTVSSGAEDPSATLTRLGEATIGPQQFEAAPTELRPFPALSSEELDGLVSWLQTTLGVVQSAIGSANFVTRAVEALVQIVGLHSGRVLLDRDGAWQIAALAQAPGPHAEPQPPSASVLDHVRSEKCTFVFHPGEASGEPSGSLMGLQAVVAAPILDRQGAVIGALYGERGREPDLSLRKIGKIEATLVELLACGVAAGLARQQQEQEAMRARVRFEQFFTAELADHLAREPDLLKGREAEVSLLFCDVRGFSRVSERLRPADTMDWIGEVMDALSACVLQEGGVLVDYVGDEILAMWGAPQPQADHARRAMRAALAMRAAIEVLSRRWRGLLGEVMQVGVGINTGPAQVGNTGSRFKFKYGPLGNSVNLASRVQGLTKYLKCPVLATAATHARLGAAFLTRRVCRAAVQGIVQPVDLFEVTEADSPARAEFFRGSEQALAALEAGNNAQAARLAGTLLLEHTGDGPLLMILSEAVRRLQSDTAATAFIWQPPGK
jgi:adenylate cyclase